MSCLDTLLYVPFVICFVFTAEIKKHVQNSVYPYDIEPPAYNIESWVRQLHLQQCAFVEVGDKYYAIFVETRPRRYDHEKEIKEYFLGLCDFDTLSNWSICSPELMKKRESDCSFEGNKMYESRVHRRFCDLTQLTQNAPQCDCNSELSDTKLFKVQGFPTCFKAPLPESLCGDNNVCGLAACTPQTINNRVYTASCDRRCKHKQPFCEPPGRKSSAPRTVRSFWTDWSNPFCTDVSCASQYDEATCINRETGDGDIDCLGPGTSCCSADLQNCRCHVYAEDGTAKVFRTFSVPQPELVEYMSEEDFINSIPLRYLNKEEYHKYPYSPRSVRATFGQAWKQTLTDIYDRRPLKLGNTHKITQIHPLRHLKHVLMNKHKSHEEAKKRRHIDIIDLRTAPEPPVPTITPPENVTTVATSTAETTSTVLTSTATIESSTSPNQKVTTKTVNASTTPKATTITAKAIELNIEIRTEAAPNTTTESLNMNQCAGLALQKSIQEFASSDSNNIISESDLETTTVCTTRGPNCIAEQFPKEVDNCKNNVNNKYNVYKGTCFTKRRVPTERSPRKITNDIENSVDVSGLLATSIREFAANEGNNIQPTTTVYDKLKEIVSKKFGKKEILERTSNKQTSRQSFQKKDEYITPYMQTSKKSSHNIEEEFSEDQPLTQMFTEINRPTLIPPNIINHSPAKVLQQFIPKKSVNIQRTSIVPTKLNNVLYHRDNVIRYVKPVDSDVYERAKKEESDSSEELVDLKDILTPTVPQIRETDVDNDYFQDELVTAIPRTPQPKDVTRKVDKKMVLLNKNPVPVYQSNKDNDLSTTEDVYQSPGGHEVDIPVTTEYILNMKRVGAINEDHSEKVVQKSNKKDKIWRFGVLQHFDENENMKNPESVPEYIESNPIVLKRNSTLHDSKEDDTEDASNFEDIIDNLGGEDVENENEGNLTPTKLIQTVDENLCVHPKNVFVLKHMADDADENDNQVPRTTVQDEDEIPQVIARKIQTPINSNGTEDEDESNPTNGLNFQNSIDLSNGDDEDEAATSIYDSAVNAKTNNGNTTEDDIDNMCAEPKPKRRAAVEEDVSDDDEMEEDDDLKDDIAIEYAEPDPKEKIASVIEAVEAMISTTTKASTSGVCILLSSYFITTICNLVYYFLCNIL